MSGSGVSRMWRDYNTAIMLQDKSKVNPIFTRKPYSAYNGKDYTPSQNALQGAESEKDDEGGKDIEEEDSEPHRGLEGTRMKGKSQIESAIRQYMSDLCDTLDGIIETAALMVDEGHLDAEGFNAISEKVQLIQDKVMA